MAILRIPCKTTHNRITQKVTPMEQPREPQPQGGAAPYPYPYQPYPPAAPQPAPRRSAWRVFTSFIRLILRRLVYGIVWILRPIRPHAGFAIVTLVLLGVIGWLAATLYGPKLAEPADPRVAALPPTAAVENYLTGRTTFNADLMWEAFSGDYQARQLQNGASKTTMQSTARQEQRTGLQYNRVQYIGGVKLDDGGHMYYYSIDVAIQNQKYRVPIIFMTDRDEKIELIMYPLDNAASN